jgi:mTERF domain-containing protein
MSLFGSYEDLLRALKQGASFLSSDLERVVKPNVTFLRECGLGDSEITTGLVRAMPRMLSSKPERVRAMVACAEGLGVHRGSGMFRFALRAVRLSREEKIAAKAEYLKNTFRWSDAEVRIAVCKSPNVLTRSEESLQRRSEFLISK